MLVVGVLLLYMSTHLQPVSRNRTSAVNSAEAMQQRVLYNKLLIAVLQYDLAPAMYSRQQAEANLSKRNGSKCSKHLLRNKNTIVWKQNIAF